MKPLNQKKLHGYDDIFLLFMNLLKNNKLPNKIILSGPKGIGKSTFAYHFINYIFSINESDKYNIDNFEINEANRSFNLVKNLSHPNLHLIDLLQDKKFIEINQIRDAIKYCQKTSFDNNMKFILIDNIEFLNINAINALLKLLEEPNDKLTFILIHNNQREILETLRSRCIIFKKNFSLNENLKIFNQLVDDDAFLLNNKIINNYNTVGDLIILYNFFNKNNLDINDISLKDLIEYLINYKNIKKEPDLLHMLNYFIQSYICNLFINTKNTDYFTLYKYFIKKMSDVKKFNLDLDSFFIEFKKKILNE